MSLEILRKGLAVFKKHIKKRKDVLLEHLKQSEKISEEDADWLDNQANHVDEEALIHNLETASDYERGISRLDSKQKELFQSLREPGGEGNPSNKRKRFRVQDNILKAKIG
ncbi:hypothetical protein DFH08DRAFT_808595 [Mycena albidolilacea]|uniref:Uncharacterized protein n=1 Tax=Mycena albidolilacea TaxID=1033008 RepID=A0AAD7EQY5_9AGAR|nr:hypothetical protein DFH08DRAFT_808595 [Mycena albidolilacea]